MPRKVKWKNREKEPLYQENNAEHMQTARLKLAAHSILISQHINKGKYKSKGQLA